MWKLPAQEDVLGGSFVIREAHHEHTCGYMQKQNREIIRQQAFLKAMFFNNGRCTLGSYCLLLLTTRQSHSALKPDIASPCDLLM